jgi:hypothetical protein
MFLRLRSKITYANVIATLALFLALGGGAFAATSLIGSDGKIRGCVSKTRQLTVVKPGKKCAKGTTAIAWNQKGNKGDPGPSTGAASGDLQGNYPGPTLRPPEGWHEVGAPGEPGFQHSWTNSTPTVAFYKDREGVVHLRGEAEMGDHNATIFQLPAGYRPASGEVLFFAVVCGCTGTDSTGGTFVLNTGRLAIDGPGVFPGGDGSVGLGTPGTGPVHLDGITFRAAS